MDRRKKETKENEVKKQESSARPRMLIFPALLDSFAHAFHVFLPIVFIKIRGFDIRGGRCVGVIQETKHRKRTSVSHNCIRIYIYDIFFLAGIPLNTSQDGCHVIGRTPAVLQNVETKFACPIYVRMKHLANKFDARWLVGVLLLEMHYQAESAIFEGSIGGTNDDGIPRPDRQSTEHIPCRDTKRPIKLTRS